MERTRQMCPADGAGVAAGDVGLGGRVRLPHRPGRRPRGGARFARGARLAAGALCGLGVALFPGLAILALQLSLVLVWAYLMLSMVVGGLYGAKGPR